MKTTILPIAFTAVAMGASLAPAQPACEPQRIVTPPDTSPFSFGDVVATNGRQWLISDTQGRALCSGGFFCGLGVVYSYEMVDGQLVHRQTLTPPSPGLDFYGHSLDIQGNRLIVGTLNYTWPDNPRKGGAFVYEYNGEEWVEVGQIQKPDLEPVRLTDMGVTTRMRDGLAMLPAGAGTHGRAILTFRETAEGWTYHEMIESPDGLPREARFGVVLTMGGPWAFIAAPNDSTRTRGGGSVYVYRREADDTLAFVQKIDSPDAPLERVGEFGTGLAFDGQTLAVGAPSASRDVLAQGVVFTFRYDGRAWVLDQELVVAGAAELEGMGWFMSMRDGVLLAYAHRSIPGITDGRVYTFRRGADGRWREAALLVPNPPVGAMGYGYSSATDGRFVLVGAANDVNPVTARAYGAAYLFDLACTDCAADLDYDGQLTIFDYLAFQTAFGTGDMAADFDGDGELTIFDFLAFQTAFALGCE
ncbi:MAG: hypothetical protein KIT54_08285 [Phycisphaeraceae bacterium]|nr:hypothetical protein [Phycisphaeraceae bacterium]